MSKILSYVSLPNLHHLLEGLTFNVNRCAEVIDTALTSFNEQTKIPDRIYSWNQKNHQLSERLQLPTDDRIIVSVDQILNNEGKILYTASVARSKEEREASPVVFFNMASPSADIPMRLEVPLRCVIKGGQSLKGSYTVYMHALFTDHGDTFVYYGITKRGWNKRFYEHMRSSTDHQTRRLFPLKMLHLLTARVDEMRGVSSDRPKLSGLITTVCAIGLSEDAAMDTEEYLVDKYRPNVYGRMSGPVEHVSPDHHR